MCSSTRLSSEIKRGFQGIASINSGKQVGDAKDPEPLSLCFSNSSIGEAACSLLRQSSEKTGQNAGRGKDSHYRGSPRRSTLVVERAKSFDDSRSVEFRTRDFYLDRCFIKGSDFRSSHKRGVVSSGVIARHNSKELLAVIKQWNQLVPENRGGCQQTIFPPFLP